MSGFLIYWGSLLAVVLVGIRLQGEACRQNGFSTAYLGAIICWVLTLALLVIQAKAIGGYVEMTLFIFLCNLAETASAPFDPYRNRSRNRTVRQLVSAREIVIGSAVAIFIFVFAGLAFSNAFGFQDFLATSVNRLFAPLQKPAARHLVGFVLIPPVIVGCPVMTALRHLERDSVMAGCWFGMSVGVALILSGCLHLDFGWMV